MISDKVIAEKISRLVLEASSLLNESASVVAASNCPEEEKTAYYEALGQAMGTLGIDVLNNLYRTHPEIKPKDYLLPEEL